LGAHPAPAGVNPYNMAAAIEKMGREIGRSMAPLALNQQRMEETMAYHKKKELGKKDLDEFDLAKLKGWAHKRNVKDLHSFWRNVVNSDGWKKDEACLLKTMKLWSKTMGHAIDPSIYKGKKHMEQIAGVTMTVQLGRAFEDLMEGHNIMGCVFRNRNEVKRDKARDDAKEASAAT
jgi:hypothetical protein